jgi:hypothetical protein
VSAPLGSGSTNAASTPLRLIEIDPAGDARWDAYVESHRDGLVFHHSSWLSALRREYDRRPVGLAVEDPEGMLRGILALMSTRGLPGARAGGAAGPRLSSLPRTPVAGPLGDDPAALVLLVRGAVQRLPRQAQLELKLDGPVLEGLNAGVTGHRWRTSYVLDLPSSSDVIRFGNSRNHSRIRWAVNKARREGVTVRCAATPEDVRRWYPLYLETMRHHTVPPRPLRLFEAMWDVLRPREMMRLHLAERGGEMVAGSILVMLGGTVFYLFNGVRRDAMALRPNDLVQWEAIHECVRDGARHYDFGEVVELHAGLADFKRKWGAHEHRLHRYYHPAPAKPPDPGDREQSRVNKLASRAWQRVQLPLTAVAGDGVFRYL